MGVTAKKDEALEKALKPIVDHALRIQEHEPVRSNRILEIVDELREHFAQLRVFAGTERKVGA